MKFSVFPELFGSATKTKIEPLKTPETLMLSVNTSVTVGIIKKISGNEIYLSLRIPIIVFKGSKIGIARNINNHWRLIGYGELI
mgnify:FL=1